MLVLLLLLLIVNTLTEILFYKKLFFLDILEKKNCRHHAICSGLRILYIFFATWLAIPLPLLLVGMLLILLLNIQPYQNRRMMVCNFSLVMHLIFAALLLAVMSMLGLLNMGIGFLLSHDKVRILSVGITLLFIWLDMWHFIAFPNFIGMRIMIDPR